jgi:hypothetical protein
MHILVYIYVSYAMLNNIFTHFGRISYNTARGYQLIINYMRYMVLGIKSPKPYSQKVHSPTLLQFPDIEISLSEIEGCEICWCSS